MPKIYCVLCARRTDSYKQRARIGTTALWPMFEIHAERNGLDITQFSANDQICLKCHSKIAHYGMTDRGPNKKVKVLEPIVFDPIIKKDVLRRFHKSTASTSTATSNESVTHFETLSNASQRQAAELDEEHWSDSAGNISSFSNTNKDESQRYSILIQKSSIPEQTGTTERSTSSNDLNSELVFEEIATTEFDSQSSIDIATENIENTDHDQQSSQYAKSIQLQGVKSTQSICFICHCITGRKVIPWPAIQQAWFQQLCYISKSNRICQEHLTISNKFNDEAFAIIADLKQDITVNSVDLGLWLLGISDLPKSTPYNFEEDGIEAEKYKMLVGISKDNFDDLIQYLHGMRNTTTRSVRNALAMFLMLLRNHVKQELIAFNFDTTQQVVSGTIDAVSAALDEHFVPKNLGYYHISREAALEKHSIKLTSSILGQLESRLCLIADCTYNYIEAPSNFEMQRKTFSLHKKRNLLKPLYIVLPSGYILEAAGPYFCDAKNNDAANIRHHYKHSDLLLFLEEDDFFIFDRGFRDVVSETNSNGQAVFMPCLLGGKRTHFTCEEANESRKNMAPKCYICNYYDPKNISLFRIPDRNDDYSERCGLWLKLLNEQPQNMHKIRICSEHFLEKKPAKSGDFLNLDWVPNKNLGKFSKNWELIAYHFRKNIKKTSVQNLQVTATENRQTLLNTSLIASKSRNDNFIKNNSIGAIPASYSDNIIKNNNFNVPVVRYNADIRKINSIGAILASNNDNFNKNDAIKVTNNESLANSFTYNHFKIPVVHNNDSFKKNRSITVFSDDDLATFTTNSKVSVPLSVVNNDDDFSINNFDANNHSISAASNTRSINNEVDALSNNDNLTNGDINTLSTETATNNSRKRAVVSFEKISYSTMDSVITKGQAALDTVLIPVKKKKIQDIAETFFFSKDIQTELSSADIDLLFKYYQDTVDERDELLLKISTLVFDVDFFKENDKKTRFYTGLPTWSLLNNFFEMVKNSLPNHFNCKLSRFQMLVLTLLKLRLNLSFTDIGYRFQIDETTASRYFHRCLYILYKLFYNSKLIRWPERQNLLLNIPSYFRSTFKESVTIIIDCFEIFIERSSILKAVAQSFSHYKHHVTLKYLIGISVTGVIIFISPAFGGRSSDKDIVVKSKFLDNLQEGDVVLADKGFKIQNEVNEKQASVVIPSFIKHKEQLDPLKIEESRECSRTRIHVERVICVLREKFNMCSDIAKISAISKRNDLFDNDLYDKIIFVCSCLANICPSVVPTDFEM